MMLKIKKFHKRHFLKFLGVAIICISLYGLNYGHTYQPDIDPGVSRILPNISVQGELTLSKFGIPKIVHQTWKTHHVPALVQSWVQSWTRLNPTWQHWFWTDEGMRQLIAEKFPGFLDLYDRYPSGVHRADAFRYFVMYEYGGVYADLDVECLQPLDPIIDLHDCIITQEPFLHVLLYSDMQRPLVSNAIIACQPNHKFMKYILNGLRQNAGPNVDVNVLFATGPFMMTKLFQNYQENASESDILYLADPETFQPTFDISREALLKRTCSVKELEVKNYHDFWVSLCRKFRRGFLSKVLFTSYTNHHWTHLWAGDPMGALKSPLTFDVHNIMTNNSNYRVRLI